MRPPSPLPPFNLHLTSSRTHSAARPLPRMPALLAGALCLLLAPPDAGAGGLFGAGHGVRATARGGAFTAAGDDPSGLWYNPANIGVAEGTQVLVDTSFYMLHMDYQRTDSGGNVLPSVSNEGFPLPLPTVAFTTHVLNGRLALGASLAAPYAPLPNYPEPSYTPCADPANPQHCIATAHTDSPQRYSLVNLEGTLFLQLDLAAAYELVDGLVVGVSLQNLFANYSTLNSTTSYNGAISSGPEDPEFDALSKTEMMDLFNPSAKLGLIYRPHPMVRFGASLQLPFWIGGDATAKVQLPVSPIYEKSSVEGDRAEMSVTLPLMARFGVELRPLEALRVALDVDYQNWSNLQEISVKPKNIYILNIPSVDRYQVPALTVPLHFRDTFSVGLGAEYALSTVPLVLRGGLLYERGAVENAYASVLAMDANKVLLTVGLGYSWRNVRIDLLYAHEFKPDRTVDYRDSLSTQINPINPGGAVAVGGGRYSASSDIVGLGVNIKL